MAAMQNLCIDDGIIELNINNRGVLRFNPSDFNLYNRMAKFIKELPELEKKYHSEVELSRNEEKEEGSFGVVESGTDLAKAIDTEVKERLNSVFGLGADFDTFLGGVNCMGFGMNGERIITNTLNAITPYLENGVQKHMDDAAETAKLIREKRRAMQSGT